MAPVDHHGEEIAEAARGLDKTLLLAPRADERCRDHQDESHWCRRREPDIAPPQVGGDRWPTIGECGRPPVRMKARRTVRRRTGRVAPSQLVRAATATGPTGRRASGATRASARPLLIRAVTPAAHHETYLQVDELSRRRNGSLGWHLVRQVPGTVSKCPPRTTDNPATAQSPKS